MDKKMSIFKNAIKIARIVCDKKNSRRREVMSSQDSKDKKKGIEI